MVQVFDNNVKYAVRCCSNTGNDCITPKIPSCSSNRYNTYDEAVNVCEHYGRRLCKINELDKCCTTGCNADIRLVWVSEGDMFY